MSGRTTAEIVADLRRVDGSPTVGALRREAADRLAELDAQANHWALMWDTLVAKIEPLRPPCPTCGGTGVEQQGEGVRAYHVKCVRCVDGKLPIEQWIDQLVATYNAVQANSNIAATPNERLLLNYLRGVKR